MKHQKTLSCTCKPEVIQICIAGDYDDARRICREWCSRNSRCVTVEKADYIYTFGEESGVIVTFRSYPRFPPEKGELETLARDLLHALMEKLCQRTAMLCLKNEHIWFAPEKEPQRK